MPTFPRTIMPREATKPRYPGPLKSIGHTGKAQVRSTLQRGITWEETFPPLRAGDPDTEALTSFIEEHEALGTILDTTHPFLPGSGRAPNGAGGGTPTVDASESGNSIATSAWSNNITNVVRAGDYIRIAGINSLFRITADADSNGTGLATLAIHPAITVAEAPGAPAAITRTSAPIRCIIDEVSAPPSGGAGEWLAGLKLRFREVP